MTASSSLPHLALLLLGTNSLVAHDKTGDHLFRPTPKGELRDLSTDRPDKTESAFTVDAGHFQIEADLLNWSRDRSQGMAFDGFSVGSLNLKAGLTHALDLQVIVETYRYERFRTRGLRQSDEGFGDLTLRAKYNLWGNDGGRTALALMPFVTLPTASGDFGVPDAEAGLIIPLAIELGDGWGMGLMTEIDFLSREDGGHEVSLINSITVAHDLTKALGMFVEFFSEVPVENSADWVGSVDIGFTYALTPNIQLDAGVNFGVTEAADDVNPFLGLSMRF